MNFPIVFCQLGLLGCLFSASMLLMSALFLLVKAWTGQLADGHALTALFITGLGGLMLGAAGWWFGRRGSRYVGRKEALLLVAASWLMGGLLGALPFWIWAHLQFEAGGDHPFTSFVNCYFESVSGLTTTGSSILSDIEGVPHSLLLWRAMTQWLGGIGIVVLFVAVLPGLGIGGKRLFEVESAGPAPQGLQPHIRETARWLLYIYLGLTLAETLALWVFTPMDLFDAVCHTFATLATGGYSTRNASVGAYHHTPAADAIVITFMVLAGVNFGLYYRACRGNFAAMWRDTELRFYLGLLAGGALIVGGAVWWRGDPITLTTGEQVAASAGESLRQGLFTTVSLQTVTGFCTADYNAWPFLSHVVLVLFMFMGGCAGSTAGGIKLIRVWVTLKVLLSEVERTFRPSVVRPVRVGTAAVDAEMRLDAVVYVLSYVLLFAAGAVAIMLIEQLNVASDCDFTTAATAAVATLSNVGPGLGSVGAAQNYAWFTDVSKLIMCALMVLGRLEIFAIAVLFNTRFWQRS